MSNLTKLTTIFKRITKLQSRPIIVANYCKKANEVGDDEVYDEDAANRINLSELLKNEEDDEARQLEIQNMRNKSKLNEHHRAQLKKMPSPEFYTREKSLREIRIQYGKFGAASGVDPRLLFPTPQELEWQNEFVRVSCPHTIPEMVAMNRQVKDEKLAKIRERDDKIEKNLAKLDQWTAELNARIAKKEAVAREAREKRERLLEEVRRHFGFKMDPRDPRFKELLEKKELEEKKASKLAKKQKKQDDMLKKLQQEMLQPPVEKVVLSQRPPEVLAENKEVEIDKKKEKKSKTVGDDTKKVEEDGDISDDDNAGLKKGKKI